MRFIGPELILATTDLTKFVRCDHSTFMDHGTKNGTISPLAHRPLSAMTELIGRKGDEHEHAYVERLRAAGKRMVTIEKAPWSLDALRRAETETLDAMRSGADYVCQAAFFDGRWSGYADLLERVDRPSPLLGAHSYEVVDTKLARSVRAHFILQLSDYSHHLARLQGRAPESMHVVLGTNQPRSFRVRDFDAYYRHVRASLDRFLVRGNASSPYPVEFCALCNWCLVRHGRRTAQRDTARGGRTTRTRSAPRSSR